MTVDDRLRAAHARIPEPDEATIARARARLLAAMATAASRCRGARVARCRRRRARRAALGSPSRCRCAALALRRRSRALSPCSPPATPARRRSPPAARAPAVLYQRNTFHVEHDVHRRGRPADRRARATRRS